MQKYANRVRKINQRIAEWKEHNASILDEKKLLQDELKVAKERLMAKMEQEGQKRYVDDDGTVYTLKNKNKETHSSQSLKEVFGDDPKLQKYMNEISEETTSVSIRKKRKTSKS